MFAAIKTIALLGYIGTGESHAGKELIHQVQKLDQQANTATVFAQKTARYAIEAWQMSQHNPHQKLGPMNGLIYAPDAIKYGIRQSDHHICRAELAPFFHDSEPNRRYDYISKDGLRSSDCLGHYLKGSVVTECYRAASAYYLFAIERLIGTPAFDRLFKKIWFGHLPKHREQERLNSGLPFKRMVSFLENVPPEEYLPGDWLYFTGINEGTRLWEPYIWSGINVIYVGMLDGQRYYIGMGLSEPVTEAQIEERLIEGYCKYWPQDACPKNIDIWGYKKIIRLDQHKLEEALLALTSDPTGDEVKVSQENQCSLATTHQTKSFRLISGDYDSLKEMVRGLKLPPTVLEKVISDLDAAETLAHEIKQFQLKRHPENFYASTMVNIEKIKIIAYASFNILKTEHPGPAKLLKTTILRDIMPLKAVLDDIEDFEQ